ncbi:MAG: cellulase family glycosylhydrolase [Clostridia bacterium]|nr:cellulase family glycosylhydrolase [Clostridia bacterium]
MFKKSVIALILVGLLMPVFPVITFATEPTIITRSYTVADRQWYDQNPSKSEFTISTAGELAYFMHLGVGTAPVTFQNKTVKLGADIIWNDGIATETGFAPTTEQGSVIYKWIPYASETAEESWNQFRGVFDGQGHTVSGLYIAENNVKYSGFFSRVRGATIQNVSFVNSYHCLSGNISPSYAGMVVGSVPSSGCTFMNISVNAIQNHNVIGLNTYFGGICGGHSATLNTVAISFVNCTVRGQLEGVRAVGGILGGLCVEDTVSMTDCICYASISAASDLGGLTGRHAGGGSYTRCAFFGMLSGSGSSVLVTLRYNNLGVDQTSPLNNASCKQLSFQDCFYTTGRGVDQDYPVAPASTAVGYKISVGYTGIATPSEAYYRNGTVMEISAAIKAQFDNTNAGASFSFPAAGTDVVKLEGFQTKDETNVVCARFILSVKWGDVNPSNVSYVGFQTAVLNEYALGITDAVQTQSVGLYASVPSLFGQGSIGASSYGADALGTLSVEIPASGIQNMMVRATYRSAAGNDFHGAWTVLSIINGQDAGSTVISTVETDSSTEPETVAGLLRIAVDPGTNDYDLESLFPNSATIEEAYSESWVPLESTTVSLLYGTNHFQVICSDSGNTYQTHVSIHRRENYRVVFNSNGGSYIPPRLVTDGTVIPYNASVTPTRPGYTFQGWYREDGTRVYLGNTEIHGDMYFIAHWNQGTAFSASQTTPFTYTASSAALNIVWKDYANAFGERPERVLCTLTNTANHVAYSVEVRENSAFFVGSSPANATISTGAGSWTVKISGLSGTYTFVQSDLQSTSYSSFQSGTTVTNTISGYQPTFDQTAALYTANGRFYDLAGNVVVLKGVVTVNVGTVNFAGNTGKASLARLKAEGVNCIRITMQLRGAGNIGYLYQSGGTTPQTSARQAELMSSLRTAIDNATGMGMYCIADWGVLGENPTTEQTGAISFFTDLATVYRDNPYVLYEICNEPNIQSPMKWNTSVKPYAEAVIEEIRTIGARGIVIVAPNNYARNISEYTAYNQRSDDPIDYPIRTDCSYNVAYTFHIYAYNIRYNTGNPVKSFGWRMREAIEAGLTLVMTEFSPATSDIGAQSAGVMDASIPEANKYLNVALENDVNVFLFRYISHFASGNTSSQHMFVQGIVNDLNNGTWTESQLTECGAWFYHRVLRANGFIPVANFASG